MRSHQLFLRATLTAAAAVCIFQVPAAHADEATLAPPPIAAFYDSPQFSGALLSPSGKYLAVRVAGKESRDLENAYCGRRRQGGA